MMRDMTCGDMRKEHIGKEITISGWVHSIRDHGGITFIDLRDKYGLTQAVLADKENIKKGDDIGREYVVKMHGTVRERDESTYNPKIPTGEVELLCSHFEILSKSRAVPFEISDSNVLNDDVRMKYRFLDLRRKLMQDNLSIRHKANMSARNALSSKGFVEFETPYLVRSTPEGARDFIVPSRINPGKCYALPQSPQIYKQILMASGSDRYFQFARCFRDEDLRADRQPEHTQLDVEMSFAEPDDVMSLVEDTLSTVAKEAFGKSIPKIFRRIPYEEAISKYGTDKPDLRYGLEISDVTGIVKDSSFSVFKDVIEGGGRVKLLNPEIKLSRAELDEYISYVQSLGGKGMAWMIRGDKLESNIVKYFPEDVQSSLMENSKEGTLMFIADKEDNALEIAGELRKKIAHDKEMYDTSSLEFCWVDRFPMFSWNDDNDRWDPEHHMFTMPTEDTMKFLYNDDYDPGKVYAESYDLVLNGVELASGSRRICDTNLQKKIMKIVGYSDDEIKERFGFMMDIFDYGAPPHSGIGIGFDRLITIMLGYDDIREVIPFPKNKSAESLLDRSPTDIREKQMKELKLKLDFVKRKEDN